MVRLMTGLPLSDIHFQTSLGEVGDGIVQLLPGNCGGQNSGSGSTVDQFV